MILEEVNFDPLALQVLSVRGQPAEPWPDLPCVLVILGAAKDFLLQKTSPKSIACSERIAALSTRKIGTTIIIG